MVFGNGQYAPDTIQGKRLLAHEHTHVVQQDKMGGQEINQERGVPQLKPDETSHPEKPTPQEYIDEHTHWFNLHEGTLAADLFVLAWESSDHFNLILEVFKLLSPDNQLEVAELFFCTTSERYVTCGNGPHTQRPKSFEHNYWISFQQPCSTKASHNNYSSRISRRTRTRAHENT